jgi:hypothetical protein
MYEGRASLPSSELCGIGSSYWASQRAYLGTLDLVFRRRGSGNLAAAH